MCICAERSINVVFVEYKTFPKLHVEAIFVSVYVYLCVFMETIFEFQNYVRIHWVYPCANCGSMVLMCSVRHI